MSSSSQVAGGNYLTVTGVSSAGNALTVRGWTRANSWTKQNYAVVVDINNGRGITQDPVGAGTAQLIAGWCWDGGSGFPSTSTITTTLGEWFFWAAVSNGAAYTVYWSIGMGPLKFQTLTCANLGTTTDVRIAAELVANDEFGDYSYRDVVIVPDVALSYPQVLAERNAGLTGPRSRAGARYLRALGANVEQAEMGANWTKTGTFIQGIDEPRIIRPSAALQC